jgi:small subunit ribosomal protein S25e
LLTRCRSGTFPRDARTRPTWRTKIRPWPYTLPSNPQHAHTIHRSKGKVKDKAQHAVILDKTTSEKLYKDVPSFRLVTVATLVDRMKINGSLARQCIKDLEEKGIIKPVVQHSKMKIYSTSSPTQPRTLSHLPGHRSKNTSLTTSQLVLLAVPIKRVTTSRDGHDHGFSSLWFGWPGCKGLDIKTRKRVLMLGVASESESFDPTNPTQLSMTA